MKKLYRDLTPEAKASYGITKDLGDDSWVYCPTCGRAMPQGDCILGEGGGLCCGYEDCGPESGLAGQSLQDWDTYAQEQGGEAAHWPEKPELGKRYGQGSESS